LAGWNRPIPKGFLRGYLDLVFRRDGYYYVVDWKSNRLNGHASGFAVEGIRAEMAKEGYFFQYLLYSVVLHRFLK
jgi:exodeoxyribonuclease V beta subunit